MEKLIYVDGSGEYPVTKVVSVEKFGTGLDGKQYQMAFLLVDIGDGKEGHISVSLPQKDMEFRGSR